MARGVIPRLMFVPNSPYQSPDALANDLQRWGNYLPFGSFGFQVASSVPLLIPAGAFTTLAFDSILQDRESWMTAQVNPFSAFIVPPGGSGAYLLNFSHRLTAPVNGGNGWIGGGGGLNVTTTPTTLGSASNIPLSAGDVIVAAGVTSFMNLGGAANGGRVTLSMVPRLPPSAGFTQTSVVATIEDRPYTPVEFQPIPFQMTPFTVGTTGLWNVDIVVSHDGVAPGATGTYQLNSFAYTVTRIARANQQLTVAIQVNNTAVTVDDISTGIYGETSTIQWLNEGDVISVGVMNTGVTSPSLAADPIPDPATPLSPLFSALRLSLT